jgi:curved DNA-binding protein CbpA
MSDRDYYEILGLTPRADGSMVDQAYWHLVRKYQALAATNPRAQRMIDEVNEAYGVLGNPNLREQYDAFRDDVLIRRGMIQPVAAKRNPAKAEAAKPASKALRALRMPGVTMPRNWRTYSISAVIAVLAFAAAWQGVNVVLVTVALAAGLGFSLTPTLTRRMSEMNLEMAEVAMPAAKAPRLALPKMRGLRAPGLRDPGSTQKDEPIDADALGASTRDIIARWRKSVGLKTVQGADTGAPSGTLMEIVDTERQIAEGDTDPFGAVMDILRSGAKAMPEKTP